MSSFKASKIQAPAAAGQLSLITLKALEGISQLGEYNLEVQASQSELDSGKLLGKTLGLSLSASDSGVRWIHGHITALWPIDSLGRQGFFSITLRPWLWFLTLASKNRLFQEKSVVEILESVLGEYSGTVDWRVTGDYESMDYCVQYAESDFDFVCRLMEEAGLYYFFVHRDDAHELVIVDSMNAHRTGAHCAQMSYRPEQDHFIGGISSWAHSAQVTTGKVSLTDYDFRKANSREASVQVGEASIGGGYDFDDYEHCLYPGLFTDQLTGDAAAKVQVESLLARQEQIQARHSTPYLLPGHCFELTDHPLPSQNARYLVVQSSLYGDCPETTGGLQELRFAGQIEAIKSTRAFRAPIVTPRPVIAGPQTAFVVGKSGEDLWVDKDGRVKVKFHWDQSGRENENCSCWVRVAQPLAGKSWGAMFLPRVGQEVLVEFLDGNPDRPVVTGTLYNAGTRPPWKLPDFASRSGLKSHSLGDPKICNELRFEDKDGGEQLLIRAGRNQDVSVGNDSFSSIGNDCHIITGANQFIEVAKDLHESVKGDRNAQVGQDCSLSIDGDHHVNVAGKQYSTADRIDLKGRQVITIEADTRLILKVGPSSLVLDASGVSISGVKVSIDSSAIVDINGGGGASATGAQPARPLAATAPEAADDGQQ